MTYVLLSTSKCVCLYIFIFSALYPPYFMNKYNNQFHDALDQLFPYFYQLMIDSSIHV